MTDLKQPDPNEFVPSVTTDNTAELSTPDLTFSAVDLLADLDTFARDFDAYEYGLPMDEDSLREMEAIVKKWVEKHVSTTSAQLLAVQEQLKQRDETIAAYTQTIRIRDEQITVLSAQLLECQKGIEFALAVIAHPKAFDLEQASRNLKALLNPNPDKTEGE